MYSMHSSRPASGRPHTQSQVSLAAADYHFDGTSKSSPCRLKRLQRLLQLESMSNQRLHVDDTRRNHGQCRGISDVGKIMVFQLIITDS